jgi:aspartate/methionine/tyrosine aminotransferase
MDMVNSTGILTVPGSGFGQKEGTYHYRMTNLVTPTGDLVETLESLKRFNTAFHNKYA